jgi:outer membrane protein assembly factor BamE
MRLHFLSFVRLPAYAAGACGVLIAASLTGCALINKTPDPEPAPAMEGVQMIKEPRFLGIFSPYRIDVQQGNFISSETMTQMRDAMKRPEGMTRDQVKFLLGTPLVNDVFHENRWSYVFRLRRGNGEVLTSHVTVTFKGNKLDSVDGTNLPTEKEYITLIAGKSTAK